MGWLETMEVDEERLQKLPFRFPVQWVNRPSMDFRGFSGTIASGVVKTGDRIRVQPSGRESRVARIVTYDGDLEQASTGQSITLTLTDELDISRGDLISAADVPAEIAAQFEATIVWMSDQPMLRGRSYLMKIGPKTVPTTVSPIKYRVNVNTSSVLPPKNSNSMRLVSASCNWTSPSVSILTLKTATQAVSFSLIASRTTLLEPECCDSRYGARTTFASNTSTSTRPHELH